MTAWLKYFFWGICAGYIWLITFHFLCQRPLWNDELCVLNNIAHLSPHDLFFRSLLSDQAFPRLYLWCIQQISRHFDYALWSLHLFPFICMLGAFLIWMRIGLLSWPSWTDRLNFVFCWAASIPLIYYAAELKQYSMDVLAGAALTYLLLRVSSGKISTWWLLVFPLIGIFSYPVLFLMFIPVYVLWTTKKVFYEYIAVCGIVVTYVWYVDARHSPAYLLETYWHDYFISFTSVPEFFKTLGEGTNNAISRWFVETPNIFRALARVFLGIAFFHMLWHGVKGIRILDRTIQVSTITLLVFIELLILGAFHKFPFTVPRMSLFFAPMLMFCLVDVFATLRQRLPKFYWPIQVMLWAYLAIMSVGIAREVMQGALGAQTAIWSG